MFWKILEIEETKDKKKIVQAYRKKLLQTNPEDKPEEFKILRQAYEEALEYANSTNNALKKTPLEAWSEKLDVLYNDFEKRISLQAWQELFSDEICLAIDKRLIVEEALMQYLLRYYRIPHEIWVFFNERFHLLDRTEELYEKYPKDFIDYIVVNGIHYEDMLPYNLFIPGKSGKDVDAYIDCYLRLRNAMYEEAQPILQEMESLSEDHPYGKILQANIEWNSGRVPSMDVYKQLYEQYPEDKFIAYSMASAYNSNGEFAKSEDLCKRLLEPEPNNERVKMLLANVLANQERYKDAIECIHDMMHEAGGDQMWLYELNQKRAQWNVILIQKYERILEENPNDHQNRVDLCWAYLQNDFFEKCYSLADTLEEEKMEPFDYYNLMTNIHLNKKEYSLALPCIERTIVELENMEEDGTEKTHKRKKRYPEMLNRKAFCLNELHRNQEAMEVFEQALTVSPDNPEIMTSICQISIEKKDYALAEEYARRIIKNDPESHQGYVLLAYALFYQRYDRGAFEAVNTALEINGSDLDAYILKIRIMVRNEAFEAAHEIIGFLEANGAKEDASVLFCKGLMLEIEEENEKEALVFYKKAASKIKEVGVYSFAPELYYRMLWIEGSQLNANYSKDINKMLKIANRGLKEDPIHYGLLDYKAWLLTRAGKWKQALTIYKQLEANEQHSPDVETQIGYIYYQTLEKDAQKSLEYYLKSIEVEDNGNKRFYAGMCHLYLGQLEEAEMQFKTLQKQNPEGLDSYFRLTFVYEAMNRLEDALENINKSIEIISQREGDQSRYYDKKVQILRRMGKVDEAVEVLQYMKDTYQYPRARQDIVETYCQYGDWTKAQAYIVKWKKEDLKTYNPEPEIRMYVVLKEFDKAKEVFDTFKSHLDPGRRKALEKTLAQMERDVEKELQVLLEQEALFKQYKHADLSHVYMNIAVCYFRLNQTKLQKEYAKKALKYINKKLKENNLEKTLFYGRKSKVLALLGKEKEAREYLERAKKAPLCDFCPYSSCKDADIYETNVEEFTGNSQKALELSKEYLLKWPDEDDFTLEIEYLEKKEIE
ncbi:MAG: tetratricopeptide repeat protein [Bacillota bacterium]|nr:tetratricopeptide repeat protein [Bacillota bacterium]